MKADGRYVTVKTIDEPDAATISQVAALEDQAFGRGGLNEWHLPVIARHGRLYVLSAGKNIIAAASLIRDWTIGRAFLFDFVVAEDERGRGHGRLLLEYVLADLKKSGIEHVELTVALDNAEAKGLYESFGFKEVAVLVNEYGAGEDRLDMKVRL